MFCSHCTATLVALLCLLHTALASHNSLSHLMTNRQFWSASLPRSIPALSTKRLNTFFSKSLEEVSSLKRKKAGYYYGIPDTVIIQSTNNKPRESLSTVMSETLEELREMRHEMEALRREMVAMKRRLGGGGGDREEDERDDNPVSQMLARRKRQREFDKIGMEVERWAEERLFAEGGEEDGWKEVVCNKLVRNKFNGDGSIRCYIKWMRDSRGTHADPGDDKEYPCIKCYATIHSPMEHVCAYLADDKRIPEYNDLMIAHEDLEEITPHGKICWGQVPQILFIQSRDFVTYCHHRWLRDGSQVVVNQACEHPAAPGFKEEKHGRICRARALRGANFISRDPDDPDNKTRIALLAHADPGGIPQWAARTAVNAVAPIEPFKLFHRIDENVKRVGLQQLEQTELVAHTIPGRSPRPAGLSQLGYAAFWPKGGGLMEGVLHHGHPDHLEPSEHTDHQS